MSYRYAGSSNSRYCVVYTDNSISLMTGETCSWTYTLTDAKIIFLEVADDATVVVGTDIGHFLIFEQAAPAVPRRLAVPQTMELKPSSSGNLIHLSDDGKVTVYMRRVSKSHNKFLASLQHPKDSKGNSDYELTVMDNSSFRINVLQKVSCPDALADYIVWNISRDFSYYLISSAKKTGSKINIEAVLTDSITLKPVKTLKLVDTLITNVLVHRNGVVFLHLSQGSTQSYTIMTKDGHISNLPFDPNQHFYYLARGFVLFEKRVPSGSLIYTAQSFAGQYLTVVNMSLFPEKGVDIGLLFNSQDLINLVYMHKDRFFSFSSELLTLSTEVKRFEIGLIKENQDQDSVPETFDYYTDYFGYQDDEPAVSEQSHISRELETLQSLAVEDDNFHPGIQNIAQSLDEAPKPLRSRSISIDFISSLSSKAASESNAVKVKQELPLETEKKEKKLVLDIPIKSIKQSEDSKKNVEKTKKEELPEHTSEQSEVLSPESMRVDDAELKNSIPICKDSPEVSEIKKLERLLQSIEERFMLGEINEQSYKDLKGKYQRQLQNKQSKIH